MSSREDDNKVSNISNKQRRAKMSSHKRKSSHIKGYYHRFRHNKGKSFITRKKSKKVLSIPLPKALTKHSDRYDLILSLLQT